MAEREDKKDEDKVEFDSAGQAIGYISMDQARVLAIEHARENTDFYGRRYQGIELYWEVVSQEESEDYYDIQLSYRPVRDFRGSPGLEQFTFDKAGPIRVRQIVREPAERRGRRLPVIAIVVATAVRSLRAVPTDTATPTAVPTAAAIPSPTQTATQTSVPTVSTVANGYTYSRTRTHSDQHPDGNGYTDSYLLSDARAAQSGPVRARGLGRAVGALRQAVGISGDRPGKRRPVCHRGHVRPLGYQERLGGSGRTGLSDRGFLRRHPCHDRARLRYRGSGSHSGAQHTTDLHRGRTTYSGAHRGRKQRRRREQRERQHLPVHRPVRGGDTHADSCSAANSIADIHPHPYSGPSFTHAYAYIAPDTITDVHHYPDADTYVATAFGYGGSVHSHPNAGTVHRYSYPSHAHTCFADSDTDTADSYTHCHGHTSVCRSDRSEWCHQLRHHLVVCW